MRKTARQKQSFLTATVKTAMISAVFGFIAVPANAQQAAAPKTATPAPQAPTQLQVPSAETLLILIRSSIIGLNQANTTNNYSVLSASGSRAFQANNPPLQLSNTFQSFRTSRIEMAPILILNPQLTSQPTITNGKMRLVGNFPSSPLQVNFDLTYEPDGGVWKLFNLGVNLTPTAKPAQPVR